MRNRNSIGWGWVGLGLILLAGAPVWSQDEPRTVPATAATGPVSDVPSTDDTGRMLTPPPVNGQSYPAVPASEERSNYLRGGVAFTTAYTDNAVGPVTPSNCTQPSLSGPCEAQPVSDVSYSVAPFIALDEATPRLHLALTYAPGFTFYQRETSLNEADQNASIDLEYRLSPHVTFSARDGFQKSSNVFNQPDLASAAAVTGSTEAANFSVIAPIADRLSNSGDAGITYQFAANSMVGASGTFTNLHYPNQAEVPGLFDSGSQSGSAFYSLRIARRHYMGAVYQYQRLLAYPVPGTNETQTHAALVFYTVYLRPRFSISFFGGPQYADVGPQFFETACPPPTGVPPVPAVPPCFAPASPGSRNWNPAAGGSLGWQGHLSSVAVSYVHLISSGSGLIGAVRMDNASASLRQQLTRRLSASVAGGYTQNDVLAAPPTVSSNGHTILGTAGLQQQFGQHLNLQLGYTRLHQDYASVAVLATPNTNREFVSISYQFAKALGR
jgi:hypothetical protein